MVGISGTLSDEKDFSRGEIWTLNRYAVADSLAIQFQNWMLYTDRALHWLVFLSFSSFVLYAHLERHPFSALVSAVTLLIIGFVVHKIAEHNALDEKRLDYRALAEGCRVRFFWLLAGVRDSVPDNYLGKQRTELDWIRYGLRGWEIGLDHHPPAAWSNPQNRQQFVLEHWVEDQRTYFGDKVDDSEEKSGRMERFVTACLYIAVTIGFLLLVATKTIHKGDEPGEPIWMVTSIIAIDLLLAGAALVHHANERMAHSEHLKQYRRMLNIFDNAAKSIKLLSHPDTASAEKACVQALGREALIENGDWVLLHRERPLEIPHP